MVLSSSRRSASYPSLLTLVPGTATYPLSKQDFFDDSDGEALTPLDTEKLSPDNDAFVFEKFLAGEGASGGCQDPLAPSLAAKLQATIAVLNGGEKTDSLVQDFNAKLLDVDPELIEKLIEVRPTRFAGRVADWNDNLIYEMQKGQGLRKLLEHGRDGGIQKETVNAIHQFEQKLRGAIGEYSATGNEQPMSYLGSFLETESTIPQPPHVDFTWETLRNHSDKLSLGFFPLTSAGMFLQLWPSNCPANDTTKQEGVVVYIPFGKLLIVPPNTIHGGGFKSHSNGNLRFHLYIATPPTAMPKFVTNTYTLPEDRRYDLSERYINPPHLEELVERVFL